MFTVLYSVSQRGLPEQAVPLPPPLSHLIRLGTQAVEGLPWRTEHVEGLCLKTGSWRSVTRANPITSSESAGEKGKNKWGIEWAKIETEGHLLPPVIKDYTQT